MIIIERVISMMFTSPLLLSVKLFTENLDILDEFVFFRKSILKRTVL